MKIKKIGKIIAIYCLKRFSKTCAKFRAGAHAHPDAHVSHQTKLLHTFWFSCKISRFAIYEISSCHMPYAMLMDCITVLYCIQVFI